MAVLTADQLSQLRILCASELVDVTWAKAVINAALQAIEDDFEGHRSALSTSINTATAPFSFTFTANQKKALVKFWLLQKFNRGG